MNIEQKDHLAAQRRRRVFLLRIKQGILKTLKKPRLLAVLFGLLLAFIFAISVCDSAIQNGEIIERLTAHLWKMSLCVLLPAAIAAVLYCVGTPHKAGIIGDDLQRAGITNNADEPPILLEKMQHEQNRNIQILTFQSLGIPMEYWVDNQMAAETALDAYIVAIHEGRKRNEIILHTVSSEGAFPTIARWSYRYLSCEPATIVLGITVAGTQAVWNLEDIPHALIGGSSGSGKSVLMRLMMCQTLLKGMQLFIADFKGGLDYLGKPWSDRTAIITDMDSLIKTLADITDELEYRKQLFFEKGCRNIEMYNRTTGGEMKRIVFGCDEVAELTDKSGISDKDTKAKIDRVIAMMSTIARQGRALGIHLILATQRPDANVLPGQIKNNIDFRACGRADNTLAIIILDNARAADMLPKDGHRFMLSDGTIFLPYFWEE